MKLEVTFVPAEPVVQSLEEIGPMVLVKCTATGEATAERYKDSRGNVWSLHTGEPTWRSNHPEDYRALEVLGPVQTLPPEGPPEPPVQRLDQLPLNTWAMCYRRPGDPHWPRCRDKAGRVSYLDGGLSGALALSPKDITPPMFIVAEVLGQVRYEVTDDG
jgi:hypothetical protein